LVVLLSIFHLTLSAEIYDCFVFFNELELLKVRFEELYDKVDHFVLVEAKQTFCGDPKPLYFAENAECFAQYKHKIIHVVVEEFPPPTNNLEHEDWWVRHEFQLNAALRGLESCNSDDIIMISDLDEIPHREAIDKISNFFEIRKKAVDKALNGSGKRGRHSKNKQANQSKDSIEKKENRFVCALNMRLLLFHLNCESWHGWNGAVKAAPYWLVKKRSPWNVKLLHMYDRDLFKIENAGWHFHSMGGYARILDKLSSIYRYDNKSFTDPAVLRSMVPGFNDLKGNESVEAWPESLEIAKNPTLFMKWSRTVFGSTVVPFDAFYPKYILENLDYFRSMGWVAD